ncbi:MAG: hypothetical protein FWH01_10520, partial [Oscillospiraceae bacterium]|nr:hypothetical protein [Oscillospiraceae bacterium]
MSIVKMSKVSLAGMLADRDRVIARVMKLGLVEIISCDSRNADGAAAEFIRADNEEARAAELEREMNNVGAAIDIIERYAPEKKPMFYSGKQMRADEYKLITYDFDKVESVVAPGAGIEASLVSLRDEGNRLTTPPASPPPGGPAAPAPGGSG